LLLSTMHQRESSNTSSTCDVNTDTAQNRYFVASANFPGPAYNV
jgi:hypothetical protein